MVHPRRVSRTSPFSRRTWSRLLLAGWVGVVACADRPGEYRGKDASEWIEVWRTDKKGRYAGAEKALETIGALAVPALVEALADEAHGVRLHAARTIAKIGLPASAAAPAMAPLLLEDDEAMLRAAAIALSGFGVEGAKAAATMIPSDDPEARRWSVWVLTQLGPDGAPAAAALADRLADDEVAVRDMALTALVRIGEAGTAALVPALGAESSLSRRRACDVVRGVGAAPQAVLRKVVDLLGDPDAAVAGAAQGALVAVGDPVAPLLRSTLMLSGPARRRAAVVLSGLGPVSIEYDALVRDLLQDADVSTRLAGAVTLARTGRGDVYLLAILMPAITQGGAQEVNLAERGLVGLGALAVSPMVDLLRHGEGDQRDRAGRVLAGIGGPVLAEQDRLLAMLEGERTDRRVIAARVLEAVGEPAVPVLIGALSGPTPEGRFHAAEALGNIGAGAVAAIGPLRKRATSEGEAYVRDQVLSSLESIAPGSLDVAPASAGSQPQ